MLFIFKKYDVFLPVRNLLTDYYGAYFPNNKIFSLLSQGSRTKSSSTSGPTTKALITPPPPSSLVVNFFTGPPPHLLAWSNHKWRNFFCSFPQSALNLFHFLERFVRFSWMTSARNECPTSQTLDQSIIITLSSRHNIKILE